MIVHLSQSSGYTPVSNFVKSVQLQYFSCHTVKVISPAMTINSGTVKSEGQLVVAEASAGSGIKIEDSDDKEGSDADSADAGIVMSYVWKTGYTPDLGAVKKEIDATAEPLSKVRTYTAANSECKPVAHRLPPNQEVLNRRCRRSFTYELMCGPS